MALRPRVAAPSALDVPAVSEQRKGETMTDGNPWTVKKRKGEPTELRAEFGSIWQWVSAAEARENHMTDRDSSRRERDGQWAGTSTFDEAVTLSRTGWAEGRTRVQGYRERLASGVLAHEALVPAWGIDFGPTGSIVDIPAYLAGIPTHMGAVTYTPRAQSVVKILVNITASGGINADVLALRGAVCVVLADLLTLGGYSVEIRGVMRAHHNRGNGFYDARVTFKAAGEALDLDALSFALVNPAFFRRMGFALIEGQPEPYAERCSRGYGTGPFDPPADEREGAEIYLNGAEYGTFSTEDGGIEWIREQLIEQGIFDRLGI